MSTLYALVALTMLLLAVRARYERRQYAAWVEIDTDREVAEWRALREVMYPDADSLAKRETDWYINKLDAATLARPGQDSEEAA